MVSVYHFRCPGKNDDKAVEYTYTGSVVVSAFTHLVQLRELPGHKPTHVHAGGPVPVVTVQPCDSHNGPAGGSACLLAHATAVAFAAGAAECLLHSDDSC